MSDEITVITTDVQNLVKSGASLQEIEAHLGSLWDTADEAGQTAITTVWQQTQSLHTTANHAVNLAQSAVAVANEMLQQRDAIADELANAYTEHKVLKEAMEELDFSHPLVEQLAEIVEENVYEYISNTGYDRDGIHDDEPVETIDTNGHFGDSCDGETAFEMVEVIMGHTRSLPEEMYSRLGTFITEFMQEAQEYWEAEGLRLQAELRAKYAQQQKAQQ
jgi:hypothetical protein